MLQTHLDSGGHGEVGSPTETIEHPEFFKQHETTEDSTADSLPATTQPLAISNGQAMCGQCWQCLQGDHSPGEVREFHSDQGKVRGTDISFIIQLNFQ